MIYFGGHYFVGDRRSNINMKLEKYENVNTDNHF